MPRNKELGFNYSFLTRVYSSYQILLGHHNQEEQTTREHVWVRTSSAHTWGNWQLNHRALDKPEGLEVIRQRNPGVHVHIHKPEFSRSCSPFIVSTQFTRRLENEPR